MRIPEVLRKFKLWAEMQRRRTVKAERVEYVTCGACGCSDDAKGPGDYLVKPENYIEEPEKQVEEVEKLEAEA